MNRTPTAIFLPTVTIAITMLLAACGSSDNTVKDSPKILAAEPSATEFLTTSMNNLKIQNDSLRAQIASLEQLNRSTVAHAAELETQLHDLQSKSSPPPPAVLKPTMANADDTYDNALRLFRSRNYEASTSVLQRLLDNGPPADLADNYSYWLGECAYAMKRYKEAIADFQRVFEFKQSEKKDDAQIMIANSYYALGDKAAAKREYGTFLEKFPASPYAKRAKERLNRLS